MGFRDTRHWVLSRVAQARVASNKRFYAKTNTIFACTRPDSRF